MKKVLAIILMMTIIVSLFAACGNDATTNTPDDVNNDNIQTNQTENDENNKQPAQNDTNKIVNDDGEEFIVDTSVKGSIKDDAESINSKKIVLDGITYDLPCAVSQFFDDGYRLGKNMTFEDAFDANSTTNLVSFHMYNKDDRNFINFRQIFNNSDSEKTLKECLLTGLQISVYDINSDDSFDFVLPGGITKSSTAADVLEVFGNPNGNANFEYGYNLDDQLTYKNHNESHMTYHFSFNEDGTLYSLSIELEEM